MQKISSAKLFELFSIINPSSTTFEEYKSICNNDEKLTKNTLISEID